VIPFELRIDLWCQKTKSPEAIVWHYLRDPMFIVLIQYRSVTDRQTHTGTRRRHIPR